MDEFQDNHVKSYSGMDRRRFLKAGLVGVGAGVISRHPWISESRAEGESSSEKKPGDYQGPNIVLIRFGGGVRRRESTDLIHTYAPFTRKVLALEGTLYPEMYYDEGGSSEVGHGQGTLNLLTGKYGQYKDVNDRFLGEGYESNSPTLFECLRKQFDVPDYQTLIINGEDRTQEEFYSFSNHHLFGVRFKSEVLSLYRYKLHLLRKRIQEIDPDHPDYKSVSKGLEELKATNYRSGNKLEQAARIHQFWEEWEHFYGRTGLKNPRGDRLLTELSSWALKKLKPRLIMINYNDPDYVHWGYMAHYTRAISIIDQGIKRVYEQCQADPFYRDNTIFAIAPDCGRETNPLVKVPCQHHFNSKSSREIFGLMVGPGITKNQVIDKKVEQIAIPTTLSRLAGFELPESEPTWLEDAIA